MGRPGIYGWDGAGHGLLPDESDDLWFGGRRGGERYLRRPSLIRSSPYSQRWDAAAAVVVVSPTATIVRHRVQIAKRDLFTIETRRRKKKTKEKVGLMDDAISCILHYPSKTSRRPFFSKLTSKIHNEFTAVGNVPKLSKWNDWNFQIELKIETSPWTDKYTAIVRPRASFFVYLLGKIVNRRSLND